MAIRVLLIDDDARLHELLASYLEQNGLTVTVAADGRRGLAALEGGTFDAVLLDLMMPGMDGIEVCKRIRSKSNIPIVMLTAKGDETDRVVGLELGADDYVAKPFSPRELLARMRAVLRRARPDVAGERLTVADIAVDVPGRTVTLAGKPVELTGIEFDVLVALARRAGRVVARDALLSEAGRGDVVVGERTVDVHVSHLRQKLGDDPRSPRLIKTVRGVGYVMAKEKEPAGGARTPSRPRRSLRSRRESSPLLRPRPAPAPPLHVVRLHDPGDRPRGHARPGRDQRRRVEERRTAPHGVRRGPLRARLGVARRSRRAGAGHQPRLRLLEVSIEGADHAPLVTFGPSGPLPPRAPPGRCACRSCARGSPSATSARAACTAASRTAGAWRSPSS